ncbi:MAG: hypothetical protein HY860_04545 [Chlamydiales bacterium]|nr:hypothetical protein [Chlamydiales bacterium]
MTTAFEEKYLDVLQNIEWTLLSNVQEDPGLCDYEMLYVVEQLLIYYKYLQRDPSSTPILQCNLSKTQQDIFGRVKNICNWRLGLPSLVAIDEFSPTIITIDELYLCLKRIEKSIKFWTREGGRRGYITFVSSRALL